MFKILVVLIISVSYVCGSSPITDKLSSNNRQKRLLFYDEEGNLIKTFTNPYLRDVFQNGGKLPFFGGFLNPFFSFFRPSIIGDSPTAYMIPVSDEVIQQINTDSVFQNKLFTLLPKELSVEANTLCNGRRGQIPSPMSCNNFLNCWDGWGFEQECPNALVFSSKGYCDYMHNVDCGKRKIKVIEVGAKSMCNNIKSISLVGLASTSITDKFNYIERHENQLQCQKDFETLRNEQNCNEFFICVNRVPIKFKCPADLVFSTFQGICDSAHRVHCEIRTSPQQMTTVSSTAVSTELTHNSEQISLKPASDMKAILMKNSIFNTQSWTSTHVAMSRQDAIRQLGRMISVNSSNESTP